MYPVDEDEVDDMFKTKTHPPTMITKMHNTMVMQVPLEGKNHTNGTMFQFIVCEGWIAIMNECVCVLLTNMSPLYS
jgi:hypothetical protein